MEIQQITKEKYMQTNKICLLFLFLGLLVSCQPREKFDWEIGLSAPKYYSSSPSVRFFYNNKIIHSASSNIGIQPGWGETSGGYASGSEPDEVPDSLHVEWLCGTDGYHYEGNFKLPREKMLQLFQNPVTDIDGTVRPYSLIIVGTAPGGNITVWMRAISVLTEIAKFKAENKGIWKENDEEFTAHRNEIKTSKEFVNSEYNIFHYLHGIPYSVWEKGEKEYDYDIGFTSEGNDIKNLIITSRTKEGSWYQSFIGKENQSTIELFKWNDFRFLENNNLAKKVKLPVQLNVSWRNITDDVVLNGEILMPQNLEKLMTESYRDSITGKSEHYNRIIIGAYKGGGKGVIWLTGKNKKTKLLAFILDDIENKNIKNHILYSLPKGFKFPKWEGREKLIQPDIKFWKEEE